MKIAISTRSVTDARSTFRSWLSEQDGDPEMVADMTIVASELASNAVRASPHDEMPTLRAWMDGQDVVLRVENRLRADASARFAADFDDPLRDSGRGLLLVRALTDEVDIAHEVGTRRIVVICRRSPRGEHP